MHMRGIIIAFTLCVCPHSTNCYVHTTKNADGADRRVDMERIDLMHVDRRM